MRLIATTVEKPITLEGMDWMYIRQSQDIPQGVLPPIRPWWHLSTTITQLYWMLEEVFRTLQIVPMIGEISAEYPDEVWMPLEPRKRIPITVESLVIRRAEPTPAIGWDVEEET